jgi:hypothetical protein
VPKGRTTLRRGVEDISRPRELSSNDAMPEGRIRHVFKKLPDPFDQQSDIHNSGVHDPKATLVLGLTNLLPVPPIFLAFLTSPFPKEPTSVLVKASMGPYCYSSRSSNLPDESSLMALKIKCRRN